MTQSQSQSQSKSVIADGWYRLKPYDPSRGGHKHTTRHLFNGGRRICSRWERSEPANEDPLAFASSPKCGLCLKLLACSNLPYVDPEQTDLTNVVPLGRPAKATETATAKVSVPVPVPALAPVTATPSGKPSGKPLKIPTVAERLEQIRLAKLAKSKPRPVG